MSDSIESCPLCGAPLSLTKNRPCARCGYMASTAAPAGFRRRRHSVLIGFGIVAVLVVLCAAIAGGLLLGSSTSPTPGPGSPIAAVETPTGVATASPAGLPTASPTALPATTAWPTTTPTLRPVPSPKVSRTATSTGTPAPTDEPAGPCGLVVAPSTASPYTGAPTLAGPAAVPSIAPGHFAAAAPLPAGGGYDTATLLRNGKVLFLGAGAAELYDPTTNRFSPTGPMVEERQDPLSALLPNGKVLVYGGETFGGCAEMNIESVELYDPATGRFTSLNAPLPGGGYQTVTPLFDGTVLFTWGWTDDENNPDGGFRSSALYHPATNTFSLIGGTLQPSYSAAVTLLPDHSVLFAGGGVYVGDDWTSFNTAVLYRPDHGDFVAVAGSMTVPRADATATALSDGRVLIAGGDTADSWAQPCSGGCLSSAEMYDYRTGQFTGAGDMVVGRGGHTATLMPGGRVLFIGGTAVAQGKSAEVWAGGTFSATAGSMTHPRDTTIAVLLPNGRVLVVGNGTADLYQP